MKRKSIYVGLVMAVAALLCLAGCKKDEEGEKVVLGTQFEKAVSMQKTYLGTENTVCWSEGDEVTVNTETVTVSDGSVNVTKAESYYAVYPAEGNSVGESGGTVTVPASQTYTLENGKQVFAGPMAARLDEASGILHFKNLYSLLKVTVAADDKAFTVNSISVTGTGNLAGTYGFTFSGATTAVAPTVEEITSGSTKVKLNCGGIEVTANSDKDFYLVVHPLTTAQNLTVKVYGVLNGNTVVYTHTTATTISLSRSRIGGLAINLQQLQPVIKKIGRFNIGTPVSPRYVIFAPGNLQYHQSSGTWKFADNQWEGASGDYIEYFAWGTGNNPTSISTDIALYPTFNDWGQNQIHGKNVLYDTDVWRTLTMEEWNKVLIGHILANVNGINGVVLIPNQDWEWPEGVSHNMSPVHFSDNSYSLEEWKSMETAGAVFLPARGSFTMNEPVTPGWACRYWSSSVGSNNERGYALDGTEGQRVMDNTFRYYRFSVRLAQIIE